MATKKLGLSVSDTQKNQEHSTPATTAKTNTPTAMQSTPKSATNSLTNNNNLTSPAPYQGQYSTQIQQTLQKIMNREPFEYDMNADKLYQQYKDNYTALGKTAMQDTVGNAALLTGGYGNSYGVTAGAQAYNGYMQQLNNIVPELEQRAYERWLNEGDTLYSQLSALQNADNTDYGRYRDNMGDYFTNRDFYYQQAQDALAQSNWQKQFDRNVLESDRDYNRSVYENDRNFDYQKAMDELSQSNWQQQFDRANYENDRNYNRNVYESDREYNYNVNSDLRKIIESESANINGNATFTPSDAYEFLSKYADYVNSDEEMAEALFQMYGEQDGFFDWLEHVNVPGTEGMTYADVLIAMNEGLDLKAYSIANVGADILNAAKKNAGETNLEKKKSSKDASSRRV